MKAMLLRQPGPIDGLPLALTEIDAEGPGPGEISIDVSACAVCRTDLQIVTGDLAARRLPVVPGHQAVGRVATIGPGVSDWAPGDRAGIGWVAGTCGACRFCDAGRENLCPEARFHGWDRHGGFAEQLTCRADFAFRIPGTLGDRDAAPLLCGGVIGYRALAISEVRSGGRLGLFGFGASALLTIQVARHRGCEVYVWTRSQAERERALALGAVWAGSYKDTAPTLLDGAITFAPSGDVVVAALAATDRGGTVAINAIHLDRVPQFDYDLLWGERAIRSVANFTRDDAHAFLALAAEAGITTAVEVHPLDAANEALARIADGRVRGAAVLEI